MAHAIALAVVVVGLAVAFPVMPAAWYRLFPRSVKRARNRIDRTPFQCFLLGLIPAVVLIGIVVILVIIPVETMRIAGLWLLLTIVAFAALGAAGMATRLGQIEPGNIHGEARGTLETGRWTIAAEGAAGLWMGATTTGILLPAAAVLLQLPVELRWLTVSSVSLLAVSSVLAVWLSLKTSRDASHTSSMSAFFRGSLKLELAFIAPVFGWLALAPIASITSLGATIFSLLRWSPKERHQSINSHGALESRNHIAA